VNGPGYDWLGVIGIVAMLVHATGAPACSAACSGQATVPMHAKKAPTRDFPGSVRYATVSRIAADARTTSGATS
jgi:hypothetical protein